LSVFMTMLASQPMMPPITSQIMMPMTGSFEVVAGPKDRRRDLWPRVS
jgi:hypothetical protein